VIYVNSPIIHETAREYKGRIGNFRPGLGEWDFL
jgi:hypothetical protein